MIYPYKFDWGWSFHVLPLFSDPRNFNQNLSQMVGSIVPSCLSADVASRQPKIVLQNIDTPHYDQQIGIQPTKGMQVIAWNVMNTIQYMKCQEKL